MKILGMYKNGNYKVKLFDDGTKIRETEEDEFIASFPENFDCKITNQCDRNCPMCHEKSTKDGKHGDILNPKFLNTLRPYTEIAIGGGNPLSHPDLIPFLQKLKERKIIANMTIHQYHFENNQDLLRQLIDNKLIYGLGVSLTNPTDNFIKLAKTYDNLVIHIINGIVTKEQLHALTNNNLKLLILGYKQFGRGVDNYAKYSDSIINNQKWLTDNLLSLLPCFKVISFDNLAINQLNVKKHLTEEDWNEFYMGDDGTKTMYIDLVEQKFARCSTSTARYDLKDTIDNMFTIILNEGRKK